MRFELNATIIVNIFDKKIGKQLTEDEKARISLNVEQHLNKNGMLDFEDEEITFKTIGVRVHIN